MEDLEASVFNITAMVDHYIKEISVKPRENTDGASFYFCEIDGHKISQLRKEGENWEQVWGTLQHHEIVEIGKQITYHQKV